MANTTTNLRPYPNNNPWAAGLTNGTYWDLSQTKTITWSLAAFGNDGWNESIAQPLIDNVLSKYSEVANIQFQYVGYFDRPNASPANMTFMRTTLANTLGYGSALAWAYSPNESLSDQIADINTGLPGTYKNAAGDVWLNANQPEVDLDTHSNPGSTLYFLFLHEIGHALGLKHPHDNGFTGRPTFSQLGIGLSDNQLYTVMSYDESTSVASWYSNYSLPSDVGYPSSLMPMDVIAIQTLYGANTSTRASNTHYALRHDGSIETFWDAGGIDTLDAQGSNFGWFVSLDFMSYGNHQIALSTPIDWRGETETGNFYFNAENIIGSQYSDILIGDNQNNVIEGAEGSDIVVGGIGQDRLNGSGGDDIIGGGDGADVVSGGSGTDIILITGDDTIAGGSQLDFFCIIGPGNILIQDFQPNTDILVFDSYLTPYRDLNTYYSQITRQEFTSTGLVTQLNGGVSITLVGLHPGDNFGVMFYNNSIAAVEGLIG